MVLKDELTSLAFTSWLELSYVGVCRGCELLPHNLKNLTFAQLNLKMLLFYQPPNCKKYMDSDGHFSILRNIFTQQELGSG